jgi:hypothetical protein
MIDKAEVEVKDQVHMATKTDKVEVAFSKR